MYIPAHFQVSDIAVIAEFIDAHPFGILLTNGRDGIPVATHIPFLFIQKGEDWIIEGHMANANTQSAQISSGLPAKLVIQGPHGYVSSGVYTHVNVPTYNYQAVHLHGSLDPLTGDGLRAHLSGTVARFEAHRDNPVQFAEYPDDMMEAYMNEITGFRLTVFKAEAAFKLSQNRNETDFRNIIHELQYGNKPNPELAEVMIQTRKNTL